MQSTPQSAAAAPVVPPSTSDLNAQDFENFIYLISHDVRASVRALIDLPQWIVEDLEEAGVPIDGSLETSIELMNRHTGRLDRMLVDLLTFSRIGRMQTVATNDLETALNEVLDELHLPQGFQLIRDFQCETVTMGERDVLTLLSALVQNAVRHHDKKSGRIIITSALQGDTVVVSVADDGPGIVPEFREKVFDAMSTLRPRDEVEGSGMGLAMVRKIASLNHGTAAVIDSPYGRGAMIEVRLRNGAAE